MKRFFRIFAVALTVAVTAVIPASLSLDAAAVGVSAKACIVIDADTGEVVYGKSENERLPMASTTKIMSTLIALEYDLDEEFTVDPDAIKIEGSSMGLKEGYKVTLRKLCYGMMLPSGNDAANATAVRIAGDVDSFVEMMNEKAKDLGLKNTHFVTPSGLDDYTDDHYSTAYDMAVLMKAALKNKTFREIIATKTITIDFGGGNTNTIGNTNKLLSYCKGIIGGKTGFTDKAKRCLVSACERDGATLICVTLNAPDDWNDHTALYNQYFQEYQNVTLTPSVDSFKLPVVGAKAEYVNAGCESIRKKLFGGNTEGITECIVMKPFYYAPVKKGELMGEVRFIKNSEVIAVSPITANSDALENDEELGLLDKIELFFKNLF